MQMLLVQPVQMQVQQMSLALVFAQPVQMSLVQKQPLVLVVFHHEGLLQLVHSLLKNYLLSSKNYLQGYKF
jgi:hypothetical protein